jgi:hypothetical protein
MISKGIHIVSFDVPFPADYGGVIDVFYKVKALHRIGIDVYLHCFQYGRSEAQELEKYCKEVHYYARAGAENICSIRPYIVATRNHQALLQRLIKYKLPILFEGLHTTYFLNHPALAKRYKMVRMHNIEHQYYHHLFQVEKNIFKRMYYWLESKKLKAYEQVLLSAQSILSINSKECQYFSQHFPDSKVSLLHPFVPYQEVISKEGKGDYILYHGNLSVAENEEAVAFLLKNVMPHTSMPWKIAGKNPSKIILDLATRNANCRIVANPSQEQMEALIAHAHINILYTHQGTGVKLKLLHALTLGRHCVANTQMIEGTALKNTCVIANSATELIKAVEDCGQMHFTKNDVENRKRILSVYLDEVANANTISDQFEI